MASKVQRSPRWFSLISGKRLASKGVAPSRRAASTSWLSGTNRNSASGSMKRRISQGQATRSTFTFCRVIHRMVLPLNLFQGLVQTFSQLHSAFQQFLVAKLLPRPALHDLLDSKALFPAKLLIKQVSVVDDLTHYTHPLVVNSKGFRQRFERAILPTVPESSLVHI